MNAICGARTPPVFPKRQQIPNAVDLTTVGKDSAVKHVMTPHAAATPNRPNRDKSVISQSSGVQTDS